MKSLRFEPRGRASSRLLGEVELALKEKERLEELEVCVVCLFGRACVS